MPGQLPWTQRVIATFGDFWEVYPWLVLGYMGLTGLLAAIGAPAVLLMLLYLLFSGVWLGFIFWMVVDVIDSQAGLMWIFVPFFCGPIGLVVYMLWGRQ